MIKLLNSLPRESIEAKNLAICKQDYPFMPITNAFRTNSKHVEIMEKKVLRRTTVMIKTWKYFHMRRKKKI